MRKRRDERRRVKKGRRQRIGRRRASPRVTFHSRSLQRSDVLSRTFPRTEERSLIMRQDRLLSGLSAQLKTCPYPRSRAMARKSYSRRALTRVSRTSLNPERTRVALPRENILGGGRGRGEGERERTAFPSFVHKLDSSARI